MKRKINRRMAIAGTGLVLVAGGGGAYAASRDSSPPDPQQERQALLDDVAKRLGVTSTALSDALKAALGDRIDAAVAAGRLTQAQADALKARIQSGQGLIGPIGPGFDHHGFGFFGHRGGDALSAASTYLGVTEAQLETDLRGGKSLAQVAKDQGKDVGGLVDALVAAEKAELDQAVTDGRLTTAQEDQIVSMLKARIEAMVQDTPTARPSFGPGPWGAEPPVPA